MFCKKYTNHMTKTHTQKVFSSKCSLCKNLTFSYVYMCVGVCACVRALACPTLCSPLDCNLAVSSVHGTFSGKNSGVGYHFLFQGIFWIQGLNPHLWHCEWIFYLLSHQGSTYFIIFYIKLIKICMTCVPNKMPLWLYLGAGLQKTNRTSRQNVLNYGLPPKLCMTHCHNF